MEPCMVHQGLVDPRKLDMERSQLKALALPGKLPSPSLLGASSRQTTAQTPCMETPKETAGVPLTCSWEGQLHTWPGL